MNSLHFSLDSYLTELHDHNPTLVPNTVTMQSLRTHLDRILHEQKPDTQKLKAFLEYVEKNGHENWIKMAVRSSVQEVLTD